MTPDEIQEFLDPQGVHADAMQAERARERTSLIYEEQPDGDGGRGTVGVDWRAAAEALQRELDIERQANEMITELREDLAHARNQLRERNRLYGRASSTIGHLRYELEALRPRLHNAYSIAATRGELIQQVNALVGREFAGPVELRDRIADLVDLEKVRVPALRAELDRANAVEDVVSEILDDVDADPGYAEGSATWIIERLRQAKGETQ